MIKSTPIRQLSVALLLTASIQYAHAQSYTRADIQFTGLKSIPAETALNYLPLQSGQTFSAADLPAIEGALKSSGLFDQISVSSIGSRVLVNVIEANTVGEIVVTGAKVIKSSEMIKLLADGGIKEGVRLSPAAIQKAKRILTESYAARGKYGVTSKISTRPLAGNRSAIDIKINEGVTGKINNITFRGNKAFSDGKLRAQMSQKRTGILSWLSKNDIYAAQGLEADVANIREYYRNRGYINADASVRDVQLSKNKDAIAIDIDIKEGKQYRVNRITFSGKSPVAKSELAKLVEIDRNDRYDQREVNKLLSDIGDRLGDDGYALAQLDVKPSFNESKNLVDLDVVIDAGNRVYIRRINFAGNATTEDEVLRNQMRQSEGGWFSTRDIKRSQRRLNKLGYFSNIAVNPTPVQGSNDQVDLNVAVEETLSSSIKGGIGYGQDAGAIFNFQINQRNFRGTGRNLNVGASYSSAEKSVNISSTNPYFTKNGVSQSIGVSYSETDPSEINQSSYLLDQANLNVTHGFPLNEDDTVYVGLGAEYYNITTGTATPAAIDAEVAKNGSKILNYKMSANFTKDTRDRSLFPTEGSITRLGVEVATPGSDTQYFKSFVTHKSYLSLGESAVLTGRAEVGYGDGYGDTEELPFFKNYFSGGIDSVRGFKSSSLGPRYADKGTVKGGAFETNASIGLVTPFVFAPNNDSLKTEFFVDAGNVFTSADDFDSKEIRYSGGVGLQYFSPFGIIALSYAKPFNLQEGDDEENFQFSIGLSY